MWWDWVKTARYLEAMTWAEFHGLFMSKYFSATTRHAKAQEFLELKQGTMAVMEYVARFIELACFGDDYVATDMVKVRRFENELKLFIWGKIVGLLLQDMDSMVRTALTIEREMEDARGIWDAIACGKRKEDQPSSSLGKRQRTPQVQGQLGPMTCFYCHHPRHMRRDCPQRRGSQSYGTAQSQSSVGQVRTQFVPSHPVRARGSFISLRVLHRRLQLHI